MIQDHNIETIRKRIVYNAFDLNAIDVATAATGARTAGITLEPIPTAGGIELGAMHMIAGELLTGVFPCPYDLDPQHEVGFRVHWTANVSAANAALTWILLQDIEKLGAAIALASTALDTILGLDSYVDTTGASPNTDWLNQVTSRGVRKDIGLSRVDIESGAKISINLESDILTNITTAYFTGLEMDYAVQKCVGQGNLVDRPLASGIA